MLRTRPRLPRREVAPRLSVQLAALQRRFAQEEIDPFREARASRSLGPESPEYASVRVLFETRNPNVCTV